MALNEISLTAGMRNNLFALQKTNNLLQTTQDRLDALHPQHVLQRGYAWVVDAQGRPVMHAATLRPGDAIEAVFADGHAAATVDRVRLGPETA